MSAPRAALYRKKRLAILASSAADLLMYRHGLMLEAIRAEHTVLCLTPPIDGAQALALGEIGAIHQSFDPNPPGIQLLARRRISQSILDQVRDWEPDAVLAVSGEYMADAVEASRSSGAARTVVLWTSAVPDAVLQGGSGKAMRRALEQSTSVVVHNPAARAALIKQRLVPPGVPVVLISGEGADVADPPPPLPSLQSQIVFLMVASSGQSAAIAHFVDAARVVAERHKTARFKLALARWASIDGASALGSVEYLGRLDDVSSAIRDCHVIVQLDAVDGLAPMLLAGLAAGRALIAANVPGCQDCFDEGVNGLLVPHGDALALGAAMECFVRHSDLIASQARASRLKAERRFDSREALRLMFDALDLVAADVRVSP